MMLFRRYGEITFKPPPRLKRKYRTDANNFGFAPLFTEIPVVRTGLVFRDIYLFALNLRFKYSSRVFPTREAAPFISPFEFLMEFTHVTLHAHTYIYIEKKKYIYMHISRG